MYENSIIWEDLKAGRSFACELLFNLFAQYVMMEAQTSFIPGFEFTFDNHHFVIGFGLSFNF